MSLLLNKQISGRNLRDFVEERGAGDVPDFDAAVEGTSHFAKHQQNQSVFPSIKCEIAKLKLRNCINCAITSCTQHSIFVVS